MKCLLPEKQSIFLRASVSNVCNFSCRYCAVDLGMENHTPKCIEAPLLNAAEYVRNMVLIAQHGFKNVSFTGGEPLLNPQFPEIAEGCRDIFDTIEITTNGSRLIENIEIVKKYIDVLKISIDALDPELAVKIAGNPAAANVARVIEECCRAGIKNIGFNFVYMKHNEQELPKLIDLAACLKEKYGTEIYISVLDLYYSEGNKDFWKEQFVNLAEFRRKISDYGGNLRRRLRIGCDSFNFVCNGITVNMKDSISCTHRAKICEGCTEYCQEGIYSLKHSASGWISACPTNNPKFGSLLGTNVSEEDAHELIDRYVDILNEISRQDNTGEDFFRLRNAVSVK